MTAYHIYNISWDLSWDDVVDLKDSNLLPTEMYLTEEDLNDLGDDCEISELSSDELEDLLSDTISDITGYCHGGFEYEILKEECVNA